MYKKILGLSVLVLGLNSIVFADDLSGNEYTPSTSNDSNTGIYFGAQLGMSNMHYGSNAYTLSRNTVDNRKFAGRGYFGYAFNQYISAELGYDYHGYPNFKDTTTGNTQRFLQQGIDLVGKASLLLDYGFGLYIKGGLEWVHRGTLNSNSGSFAGKDSNSKIVPVGSLGINYWFAPNIALDLAWTKTMTIGDLPTIDLWTLGFIYKINI